MNASQESAEAPKQDKSKSTAPKQSGSTFGIGIGTMFGDAIKLYVANVVPISLAAWATFAVFAVFRVPAQRLFVDGRVFTSVGVDLVGLLIAGVVAIPWYHYSLAAVDGRPISLKEPFHFPRRFGYQAVASFWFWAGILLGLRYLFGLPSIFVLLLYAFHGFVIVDGAARGGMLALGQSVRLTEGRRLGLFAVGGLFLVFNLFGAFGIGLYQFGFFRFAVAFAGLTITTSITMLSGAAIYRLCEADLPEQEPPKKYTRKRRPRRSRRAPKGKAGKTQNLKDQSPKDRSGKKSVKAKAVKPKNGEAKSKTKKAQRKKGAS